MKIHRENKSITYKVEKKILDSLSKKICKYFTADMLSLLGLFGAILTFLFYLLSENNLLFLHVVNFGIFLHWFGDSLDGRVARLRKENRPLLGHYIDHMLDDISGVIIFLGISLSSLTVSFFWFGSLIIYLLIKIHINLKASITKKYTMDLNKLGATEIRIFMISINLIILFTKNPLIKNIRLLDVFGLLIFIILVLNFFQDFFTTVYGKDKIKEIK